MTDVLGTGYSALEILGYTVLVLMCIGQGVLVGWLIGKARMVEIDAEAS